MASERSRADFTSAKPARRLSMPTPPKPFTRKRDLATFQSDTQQHPQTPTTTNTSTMGGHVETTQLQSQPGITHSHPNFFQRLQPFQKLIYEAAASAWKTITATDSLLITSSHHATIDPDALAQTLPGAWVRDTEEIKSTDEPAPKRARTAIGFSEAQLNSTPSPMRSRLRTSPPRRRTKPSPPPSVAPALAKVTIDLTNDDDSTSDWSPPHGSIRPTAEQWSRYQREIRSGRLNQSLSAYQDDTEDEEMSDVLEDEIVTVKIQDEEPKDTESIFNLDDHFDGLPTPPSSQGSDVELDTIGEPFALGTESFKWMLDPIRAQKAVEEEKKRRAAARLTVTLNADSYDELETARRVTTMGKQVGPRITRNDLATLLPEPGKTHMFGGAMRRQDGQLGDEIVNTFLSMAADHQNQKLGYTAADKKAKKPPPYHAFNSAWRDQVTRAGVSGIQSWTRRAGLSGANIFSATKIFFPICEGMHWTLACVDGGDRRVTYHDSLCTNSKRAAGKLHVIKDWLALELGSLFKEEEWTFEGAFSPQQNNAVDCGVYALWNAFSLLRNLTPMEAFSTADIPSAREMIGAILVQGNFKGFDWAMHSEAKL